MSNAELRKKTGMRGQSKSNLLSGKQCGYLLVLIFFCLFAVMPSIAGADNIAYWAPWVTKTTTNSAAINWLGVSLGSGTVDYATSSYYNEHQSFEKTIASQITGSYQHVPLTDLEPNTSYIYRARPSDNADAFSNRTFRTMPVSGPFTFIVISDAHAQDKRFKYVADAIAANETDALFILDGGDYANYDDESLWTPFFQDGDGMLAKFPLFTAIGNHEYHDPTSGATEPTAAVQYHSSFNIPTNGALNYFFDCSGIRFIILNSPDPNSANDENPSLALSQSQAPWLESLLKKSMLGVFTIHHHPIWHYGKATSDSALQPWETLYHQYHISANFAGHIHNYERLSVQGIPYFVIGNAGGKFADLTAGDAYPVWYVKGITMSLGYLKVTVDPAKNTATAQEILVGYVETDDSETVIPIAPPFTYDTITFPLASKSPITTILANNSSQSLDITDNTPVSVTAALDPGGLSGQNADWWIVASTSWGLYSLTPSGWVPGISVLAQYPLVSVSPVEIFNGLLPDGDYVFYFGVDTNPDGIIDEPLYYDGVQVHVTLDTTEHDNWVFPVPYWGNPPLAFVLADHSITSRQPWGGVSTGVPDQIWGIDVIFQQLVDRRIGLDDTLWGLCQRRDS